MKFQMYGKKFKAIIDRIGGIVPKKSSFKALETIKITAHGNIVEFQATDLIDYATIKVYANVFEDGAVWVYLSELKKALSITDDITVTATGGKLDIRGARKSYEIACHDDFDDLWVEFPEIDNNNILCRQNDNEFLRHLSSLNCMRSAEQANVMMTSFYFDLLNEKIVVLDGYRIGVANLHGMFAPNRWSFAVSGSAYACLKSLIVKSKDGNHLEIYADKKHVKFIGDDFTYVTNIMEGNYFDYRRMTEPCRADSDYTYKFDPKELSKISKEYSKVITKDNKVPMIFYNENGNVATGIQVQDYRTSDLLKSVESEYGMNHEWFVGVNPNFITDACAAFSGLAEIKGKYSFKNPIMIIDETYEFLLLPVNINDSNVEFVKRQVA